MPVPFHPLPPAAPHFDAAANRWTLSRHADVSSALGEASLFQGGDERAGEMDAQSVKTRLTVQADLARMTTAEWTAQAAKSFCEVLERLPDGGPVDLVHDVIHPWTVRLLADMNEGRDEPELARIAAEILFGMKREGKSVAEQELEQMIEDKRLAVSKSMFFGLTQTLASFLAKAWLALLEHPAQGELLSRNPELMANATEELLRFAGPVHTLHRWASSDVKIGDAVVLRGQTVALAMDSANYDTERFGEPEWLDVTRSAAGHLGLGRGAHACVGSALVRIGCRIGTPLFLAARPSLADASSVAWKSDKTLQWPDRVPVRLG